MEERNGWRRACSSAPRRESRPRKAVEAFGLRKAWVLLQVRLIEIDLARVAEMPAGGSGETMVVARTKETDVLGPDNLAEEVMARVRVER